VERPLPPTTAPYRRQRPAPNDAVADITHHWRLATGGGRDVTRIEGDVRFRIVK
jgi:hypothetical protein